MYFLPDIGHYLDKVFRYLDNNPLKGQNVP